jgi:CheY-like chemotaxis protein
MPEVNGEQLARAILADEELRSTPLVMLTAKVRNSEEVNRLLEVGFFDVLSKPVIRPGQQLLDSLRRAANRSPVSNVSGPGSTPPHPRARTNGMVRRRTSK